jgi:tetratricopeptide (TPR) repeat protein
MSTTFTKEEEAQLHQTIEMFEVIVQSQPHDYQSLEILKEAYIKLGREQEAVGTSKRIAEAYVAGGQYSSAILEYETILQHCPDDPEVQAALQDIESRAAAANQPSAVTDTMTFQRTGDSSTTTTRNPRTKLVDDGRRQMNKLFVEDKILAATDFDLCWPRPNLELPPKEVVEPFIQVIADKGLMVADLALKLLSDKTRLAYVPLDRYEIDIELARTFPVETCRRWCVLPFDRMSRSILVATANPFNAQAAKELAAATNLRLLWYLVPPFELVRNIRKVFR